MIVNVIVTMSSLYEFESRFCSCTLTEKSSVSDFRWKETALLGVAPLDIEHKAYANPHFKDKLADSGYNEFPMTTICCCIVAKLCLTLLWPHGL